MAPVLDSGLPLSLTLKPTRITLGITVEEVKQKFLQTACFSCCQSNSFKAQKVNRSTDDNNNNKMKMDHTRSCDAE